MMNWNSTETNIQDNLQEKCDSFLLKEANSNVQPNEYLFNDYKFDARSEWGDSTSSEFSTKYYNQNFLNSNFRNDFQPQNISKIQRKVQEEGRNEIIEYKLPASSFENIPKMSGFEIQKQQSQIGCLKSVEIIRIL